MFSIAVLSAYATKIRQDFPFETQIINDLSWVVWDSYGYDWTVDYYVPIDVGFIPSGSGENDYQVNMYIDPYTVREKYNAGLNPDGKMLWPNYGKRALLAPNVLIRYEGTLSGPSGWSRTFSQPWDNGNNATHSLFDSYGYCPYGDYTLTITFYFESDVRSSSLTRYFYFHFQDPNTPSAEIPTGYYLIGTTLIKDCPAYYDTHGHSNNNTVWSYSGTLSFYVNKKEFCNSDNITLITYWNRVKQQNTNNYGSPYGNNLDRLTFFSLIFGSVQAPIYSSNVAQTQLLFTCELPASSLNPVNGIANVPLSWEAKLSPISEISETTWTIDLSATTSIGSNTGPSVGFTIGTSISETYTWNYTTNFRQDLVIPLIINIASVDPTSANAGNQTICLGGNTTLTVNGGSLGTGASWKWYSGSCGGTPVNTGSSIQVSPQTTTTYYVRAEGGSCNVPTNCANVTVNVFSPPTVTTSNPSATSTTTATGGGNVTSDGGAPISARGVCWNTSANPTTSNTKTNDGSGTGTFSSIMTGLSANTTYHVRAYAINCSGTSYGSDQTFTTPPNPVVPTVTTSTPSATSTTTAISGGNVTSDGGAAVTARGVCWSTSPIPTITNSKTTDGTGTGSFTSSITGLLPGTTYHVRAYATNSVNTSYGLDQYFTTPLNPVRPTVTTTAPSATSTTTGTSGGYVTSDGGATVTARGVCWSVNLNPTTSNSKTIDGVGTGTFTSSISGLSANTIYHVRAYATNSAGTEYGTDMTFSTPAELLPPTVITRTPSATSATTGTGGGNVTSDGGLTVTVKGVCWNTTANPTVANPKTIDGTGPGSYDSYITGLTASTTYHVRAYATNSLGTSYGADMTFTTPANLASPIVTTTAPSATSTTTATCGGNVTSDGGASVTARGVCWSTSSNPTTSNSKTNDGSGTGSFTSSLTGLSANTTYHVRSYAINSVGTSYGIDMIFITPSNTIIPAITTTAPSATSTTTGTGGGNVTSDGGASVTARGVCWSTTSNPTTSNTKTTDGSGTGSFSSSITGLTAGTTYHVRAYATNSAGTAYGADLAFTTESATCNDAYEPNNSLSTYNTTAFAAALGSSPYSTSIVSNISGIHDWDVFRFNTTTAGTLTITISNPPANLCMELYDKNQAWLMRSDNQGSEQLVYTVSTTGYYYIVVGSSSGGYSCSNYTLSLNWFPANSCMDAYEPNNSLNEYNTTAFSTALGSTAYNSSIVSNISAINDWDVFRLNTTAEGTLTLTINNPPADLCVELYDKNQTWLKWSNNQGTEQLVYSVTTTGYYYIVVGSSNGGYSCSNYTLTVDWVPAVACADNYEPNNTQSEANLVAFPTSLGNTTYSKSISANVSNTRDWDVYNFNVTSSGVINLSIVSPPCDLYVELWAMRQVIMKWSRTSGNEYISDTITVPENYLIVVGSSNGSYSCSNYTLDLNWTPCGSITSPTVNASKGTSCDGVVISWNAIAGATGYDVYRGITLLGRTTNVTYTDNAATTSSTQYRVIARNACGSTAEGSDNGYKASTLATPVVSATDGTSCEYVTITWSAVTGASSYDVYRESAFLGNTGNTTFTDNNAGTTATQYRVVAKNACSNSSPGTDNGHKSAGPASPVVNASDGTNCEFVSVSWNAVSGANSYDVYRGMNFLVNTTNTSYNDYGSVYSPTPYKVIAKGSCANSTEGTDNGYRTPLPSAPVVTASDGTSCESVTITWNLVSGAGSYDVYRGSAFLVNTNLNTYIDQSASTAISLYKVIARNSCGYSPEGTDNGNRATPQQVNLGDDMSVNQGSSVMLNAGAGFTSYQWSNNATTPSTTIVMSTPGEYIYSVMVTDQNGCTDSDSVKITVINLTGVDDEISGLEYKLYPNPTTGQAYIYMSCKLPVPEFELIIHDMSGSLIKRETIMTHSDPDYPFDFDPVPGVYNITIIYGDHVIKDKIVVR